NGPLPRHRREDRSKQLAHARPHAQLVERGEMRDRDDEACDDRYCQNAVWHSNVEECDDRHPDDIEHGDSDAKPLGAQPIEPAQSEFALLIAVEPAGARQEPAPVLLHDLEATISPAVALLLVRLEAIRQQSVAVAVIGVVGLPAELEQSESKIGVFADRVA